MRYIQDPKTLKLIPAEEYARLSQRVSWQVMPDIQPYRSMIDGHIVQSRSNHRAHLKINGCVEVGNEAQKPKPITTPPGLKREIIDVFNAKVR